MNTDVISMTALDRIAGGPDGQMMKAAIPYLPPKGRQILSVYEKTRELMNTISFFRNTDSTVSICSSTASDPLEALGDIRSFCYGKNRQRLDGILNMMAVARMMQLMGQPEASETKTQI